MKVKYSLKFALDEYYFANNILMDLSKNMNSVKIY